MSTSWEAEASTPHAAQSPPCVAANAAMRTALRTAARAAEWQADAMPLITPNRERWTACVLGNAGEEFGLALYSELSDFIATIGAAQPQLPRAESP